MNNNINTLLNSLGKLREIRKADKNNSEYSSESDFTMAKSTLFKQYNYFPTSKYELSEIIAERILEEGYECDLNDIDIRGVGDDLSELFDYTKIYNQKMYWAEKHIDISKFNGHIEDWKVSNIKNMNSMFSGCSSFNQNLSRWNVSNVTDMSFMFWACKSFNKPLNSWNVSNVHNFSYMFKDCSTFNQPLYNWKINSRTKPFTMLNTQQMFAGCTAFKQDLSNWIVAVSTHLQLKVDMFRNCPLMKLEYMPKCDEDFI